MTTHILFASGHGGWKKTDKKTVEVFARLVLLAIGSWVLKAALNPKIPYGIYK